MQLKRSCKGVRIYSQMWDIDVDGWSTTADTEIEMSKREGTDKGGDDMWTRTYVSCAQLAAVIWTLRGIISEFEDSDVHFGSLHVW